MTYVSTINADSPVAFFELGESTGSAAVDQVGNQNGVYQNTGSVALGQTGLPGGGGITGTKFTSSGSGYLTVVDNAAQRMVNTLSIEMWIKLSTTGVKYGLFNGGGGASPQLFINTSGYIGFDSASVGTITVGTANAITDTTTWHHIVVTKTGNTVYLYVDNNDVTGTLTNHTLQNNAVGYSIANDTVNDHFNGSITMVAWYTSVLSPSQVTTHYNAGNGIVSNSSNFFTFLV